MGDVEINARSGALLVRHGKGMKERSVPLVAEARAAVPSAYLKGAACAAQDDTLLLSRTLGPLDPRRAAHRGGGGPDRRREGQGDADALRHYFATRFLEKNQGDIATLATVLGHATSARPPRMSTRTRERVQAMVEEM